MHLINLLVCTLLVDAQPDTLEVDKSEIRTQILLATASSAQKVQRSFTHMLTEVSNVTPIVGCLVTDKPI